MVFLFVFVPPFSQGSLNGTHFLEGRSNNADVCYSWGISRKWLCIGLGWCHISWPRIKVSCPYSNWIIYTLKPYNHLKWYKGKLVNLGGGFKYVLLSLLFGEDSQIWRICFKDVETETIWVAGMSFHDPWNSQNQLGTTSDLCRCSWTQTTPSTPRCAREWGALGLPETGIP